MLNSLFVLAAFVIGGDGLLSEDSYYAEDAQQLEDVDVPTISRSEAPFGKMDRHQPKPPSTQGKDAEGVSISLADDTGFEMVEYETTWLENLESAAATIPDPILPQHQSALATYVDDDAPAPQYSATTPQSATKPHYSTNLVPDSPPSPTANYTPTTVAELSPAPAATYTMTPVAGFSPAPEPQSLPAPVVEYSNTPPAEYGPTPLVEYSNSPMAEYSHQPPAAGYAHVVEPGPASCDAYCDSNQPCAGGCDSCGHSGCASLCGSICKRGCNPLCCCSKLHRFNPSPCHSPGNMPQHFPYVAGPKNYHYFRPYHWTHIADQQHEVKTYGGDPRHPYANDLFQEVYRRIEAK